MKTVRELLFMIRILGVRDGVRTWLLVRDSSRVTPEAWSTHHGAKPSMPGYRRRSR